MIPSPLSDAYHDCGPLSMPRPALGIVNELFAGLHRKLLIRKTFEPFCESPIELDLAVLLVSGFARVGSLKFAFCRKSEVTNFRDCHVVIIPQCAWRQYRIDFALAYGQPRKGLFLECDGHEFHSADEQVARDQVRDAAARAAGIRVMRFTGSELYQADESLFQSIWDSIRRDIPRKMVA